MKDCSRFVEEKRNIEETLGNVLVLENLLPRMALCEEDWNAINSMVASTLCYVR